MGTKKKNKHITYYTFEGLNNTIPRTLFVSKK